MTNRSSVVISEAPQNSRQEQKPETPTVSGSKTGLLNALYSRFGIKPGHGSLREMIWWGSIWTTIVAIGALAVIIIMLPPFYDPRAYSILIVMLVLCLGIFQWTLSRATIKSLKADKEHLLNELEALRDQTWELHESEERYRSLVDAQGDLMVHRDGSGKISYMNSAFSEIFGIANNNTSKTQTATFQPTFLEDIRLANLPQGGVAREVLIKTELGERWYAWLDLPVRDENSGDRSVRTVARDITEQKAIEQELRESRERAEAASTAKSRFLANVSHEMRTPLNGILGMSGLLSDTKLTPEQSNYVEAVHNSGQALLTLIEDILDMTLIEAGRLSLKTGEVHPLRLVEDICELLASRAHNKNISISSFVDPSVPASIETDPGRLRQVLINLVGNALKFTENGGVHVHVSMPKGGGDKLPKGITNIIFEVIDTGCGISKKDQRAIFEEFAQADSANTRAHGGAGLGLAISQRIVREMGGHIDLESTLDKGSTFRFQIVAKIADNSNSNADTNLVKGKSFMSLGGSEFERESITGYLASYGGAEKLHEIEELALNPQLLDVLLVDESMSKQAEPLLKELSNRKRKKLQSIIMLEPENRGKLESYLRSGFDGYLIKPVRSHSLLALVGDKKIQSSDNREVSAAKQWIEPQKKTIKPCNVLLAEDNDVNALLATSLLQKQGHTVTRAHNGKEAVLLFETTRDFDVVFMDLQMPVMDGLDALQNIRKLEKKNGLGKLPVFVLTADEQPATRKKAKSAGADGFLTKPLNPTQLIETVVSASKA